MTRTGPKKPVDDAHWQGRLAQARAFLDAARQAADLAEPGQNANPIISLAVTAAVAYADALTGRRAGVVNRQDHAAAPRLLRDVLRDALPKEQERRYRRILAEKDAAQYGARAGRLDHALGLLADLEAFAQWAEDQLRLP
jgi:hypothetical protein